MGTSEKYMCTYVLRPTRFSIGLAIFATPYLRAVVIKKLQRKVIGYSSKLFEGNIQKYIVK